MDTTGPDALIIETEFEAYLLEEAIGPWVGDQRTRNLRVDRLRPDGTTHYSIGLTEFAAGRAAGSLLLAELAPLTFATAYKILDVALERRIGKSGHVSIAMKRERADEALGPLLGTGTSLPEAVAAVYRHFSEARHAVVHRRIDAPASDGFTPFDREGNPLEAVSRTDIEGLARTALAVRSIIATGGGDARLFAALRHALGLLQHVTGIAGAGEAREVVVHPVEVQATRRDGRLDVPLEAVREHLVRQGPSAERYADVVVTDEDGTRALEFRLEDAPPEARSYACDPDNLPTWVRDAHGQPGRADG